MTKLDENNSIIKKKKYSLPIGWIWNRNLFYICALYGSHKADQRIYNS